MTRFLDTGEKIRVNAAGGAVYLWNRAAFMAVHPECELPEGRLTRDYRPGDRHRLGDGVSHFPGDPVWPAGDDVIASAADIDAALNAPVEPTLEEAIEARKIAVEVLRDEKDRAPIAAGEAVFDCDEASLAKINGALTMMIGATAAGIPVAPRPWRTNDNQVLELEMADFLQLGDAIANRTQAIFEASWAIKAQIDALDTVAAVEQFDITEGWPD